MIRDITAADRAAFIGMVEKLYSSSAVDHAVDPSVFQTTFDTALSDSPYVRALMIEDEGAPVGYAILSFTYATEVGGLVVQLEDLYICGSCRGKGLGSKFMSFMEAEYPQAKRFRLEVTKENVKAKDLYAKLGFKVLEYVQMVKGV